MESSIAINSLSIKPSAIHCSEIICKNSDSFNQKTENLTLVQQ